MCLQYWMYSKNGEIRRDETCLDYSGHDVVLYPCHSAKGNQLWIYNAEVSCNLREPLRPCRKTNRSTMRIAPNLKSG